MVGESMNVFIILIVGFVCLVLLYQIIPKMPSHKHRTIDRVNHYTLDAVESDEERIEKIEREKERKELIKKHEEFQAIMNYDVSTAYRRKGDFE